MLVTSTNHGTVRTIPRWWRHDVEMRTDPIAQCSFSCNLLMQWFLKYYLQVSAFRSSSAFELANSAVASWFQDLLRYWKEIKIVCINFDSIFSVTTLSSKRSGVWFLDMRIYHWFIFYIISKYNNWPKVHLWPSLVQIVKSHLKRVSIYLPKASAGFCCAWVVECVACVECEECEVCVECEECCGAGSGAASSSLSYSKSFNNFLLNFAGWPEGWSWNW